MRATRLRTQLSLTMAAVAIAPLLLAGFLHAGRLGAEAEAVRLEHLEDRAVLTARLIESRIAALFLQVQGMAARLDARDPEGMRKELAQLAGTSPEYLWIGVADPEGRLLASTGGMPEDADMSLRAWFRAGLQRPWVADFTDTQPLPPDLVDTPALVEMAAPVRSGEHLTGVVGAYVGTIWAETLLAASGKAGSAVLLDHRGRILLGPDIDRAVLEVSMHRRSAAVRSTAGGPKYLFASVGGLSLAPARAAGWRIVIFDPARPTLRRVSDLMRSLWLSMALAAGSAIAAGIAVVRQTTAPFTRLALFAESLADRPSEVLPPEEAASREAWDLSTALTRVQSILRTQARAIEAWGAAAVLPGDVSLASREDRSWGTSARREIFNAPPKRDARPAGPGTPPAPSGCAGAPQPA